MIRTYATPSAFTRALDARLRSDPRGLVAARRRLVFERLLVRVVHEFGGDVALKGGLALVQRTAAARTTKDVDLRVLGDPKALLPRLQLAGRAELPDFLRFEIAAVGPIKNPGLRYDAHRYRVTPTVAGRLYGDEFKLDCAFAEPIVGELEVRRLPDTLAFGGIAPGEVPLYPVVSHVAEKLHALTASYGDRKSTRTKDLPDLALLAALGPLAATAVRQAIATTFQHRATHAPPLVLTAPIPEWRDPYARMAVEDALPWPDLDAVYAAAAQFLDPILDPGRQVTTWQPATWAWA